MELPNENVEGWPIVKIQIEDLILDKENPRLALPTGATQQEVRNALFREAGILDLIESILANGGLFPGENIIGIKEGNSYRVLEGNRRLCAIQCLLNHSLAPEKSNEQLEKITKSVPLELKRLNPVDTLIAPSWEAAQPIITARHSQYAIEKWSFLSKWRRDYLQFRKTGSIEKVAAVFREEASDVISNIRNFVIIDYIRRIPAFNAQEREYLNNNKLPVSQLTWHLSKELKTYLKIDYDGNFNLIIGIDENKFMYIMERLVRAAFLTNPPKVTTRISKDEVMSFVIQWASEYDSSHPEKLEDKGQDTTSNGINSQDREKKEVTDINNGKERNTHNKGRGRRPEQYFSSLKKDISVNEQRLIRLTYELTKNDMKDRPATGILLARSLIESALIYRIKQKGFLDQMCKEHSKSEIDMKLSEILRFSINNVDSLFKDSKSARKSLEKIQSDHREYMNSIVHGDWMDPSAGEVERIAGTTRELLRTILTESP